MKGKDVGLGAYGGRGEVPKGSEWLIVACPACGGPIQILVPKNPIEACGRTSCPRCGDRLIVTREDIARYLGLEAA